MTAENNGTGAAPEGDDPFAYLYRQEGADGSSAAQQPGVPRRSYNQVQAVGQRQYGGQQAQQQYGAPAQPPNPQQPSAHYAAPETVPGGRAAARQAGGPGGPGGHPRGGRNRNGLLIGAIAVVAAVVIGIGAAVLFNDGDSAQGSEQGDKGSSEQAKGGDEQQDDGGEDKDKDGAKPSGQLPKEDATGLTLAGGAAPASDVPNAQGRGGNYVGGMNQPGSSATWDVKDIPESGKYTVFVRYGVPGEDADSTLTVNGKKNSQPFSMKNFARAGKGDWEKGWTESYSYVELNKDQNTIKISCEEGNKCNFNLDRVWLKKGWVK